MSWNLEQNSSLLCFRNVWCLYDNYYDVLVVVTEETQKNQCRQVINSERLYSNQNCLAENQLEAGFIQNHSGA